MLGTFSDDIRHDDSYLISIIESDAPQSQIKFDCIFALQGVAGSFGMIQEIPDQIYILVGDPFAAVLFTDSGAYGDASFDGGKTLQPIVIDNGEQVRPSFLRWLGAVLPVVWQPAAVCLPIPATDGVR